MPKQMTREEFDAKLRAEIAAGDLTPEAAESEWEIGRAHV